MFTLAIIIVLCTYCSWVAWKRFKFCQLISGIPGPTAYPLVGNALQFDKDPRMFYDQWCQLDEKYGKEGIFRLWFGHLAVVVLHKPEYVEKLLSSQRNIQKSTFYDSLVPWLGTGLTISKDEKWKTRRRLLTPAFHFQILNRFVPIFVKQTSVLIGRLRENVGKDAFDISPYITLCALGIICETSMGVDVNAQLDSESDYVKAVIRMTDLIALRGRSPWLSSDFVYSLTANGRESKAKLGILHGFTNKVINDRIIELKGQKQVNAPTFASKRPRMAFLDLLLEEYDKGNIDREGIREEVDTFMLGGHHTTATALLYTLYLIASNKDTQAKLQEEVDTLYGSVGGEGLNGGHLKQLSHLESVIKESLRLYAPVPIYSRELSEDTTFGPYKIPKGCTVLVDALFLHRNTNLWSNPSEFDPGRFDLQNSKERNPFAYVPFSAGPRNCIGQRFALMEEKVILSSIIRNFHISTTQRQDELEPCISLILRPSGGIWLKLTSRSK